MMKLNTYIVAILSIVIIVSFQSDENEEIEYNVPDYVWRIRLSNGSYVKYQFIGDVGLIEDRGIYKINDSTITITRTKSSAHFEGYPASSLYTLVVPNKDTITVDGLTYYKKGGAIKPPKIKKKKMLKL